MPARDSTEMFERQLPSGLMLQKLKQVFPFPLPKEWQESPFHRQYLKAPATFAPYQFYEQAMERLASDLSLRRDEDATQLTNMIIQRLVRICQTVESFFPKQGPCVEPRERPCLTEDCEVLLAEMAPGIMLLQSEVQSMVQRR